MGGLDWDALRCEASTFEPEFLTTCLSVESGLLEVFLVRSVPSSDFPFDWIVFHFVLVVLFSAFLVSLATIPIRMRRERTNTK